MFRNLYIIIDLLESKPIGILIAFDCVALLITAERSISTNSCYAIKKELSSSIANAYFEWSFNSVWIFNSMR